MCLSPSTPARPAACTKFCIHQLLFSSRSAVATPPPWHCTLFSSSSSSRPPKLMHPQPRPFPSHSLTPLLCHPFLIMSLRLILSFCPPILVLLLHHRQRTSTHTRAAAAIAAARRCPSHADLPMSSTPMCVCSARTHPAVVAPICKCALIGWKWGGVDRPRNERRRLEGRRALTANAHAENLAQKAASFVTCVSFWRSSLVPLTYTTNAIDDPSAMDELSGLLESAPEKVRTCTASLNPAHMWLRQGVKEVHGVPCFMNQGRWVIPRLRAKWQSSMRAAQRAQHAPPAAAAARVVVISLLASFLHAVALDYALGCSEPGLGS